MPFYKWRGVSITGSLQKGTTQACSVEVLSQNLLQRDIALISSSLKYPIWTFKPIRTKHITAFFSHSAQLLNAGLSVETVLTCMQEQPFGNSFKAILWDIRDAIRRGSSFAESLSAYPMFFDQVMITVIEGGQASGNLSSSFSMLAKHLERNERIKQAMRKAAAGPLITMVFFLVIAVGIIMVMVPMFAGMFESAGIALPKSTQFLLFFSSMLTSWRLPALFIAFSVMYLMMSWVIKRALSKETRIAIKSCLPFFGSFMSDWQVFSICSALSTLQKGGVSLKTSLETLSSNNPVIAFIQFHVENGKSLPEAFFKGGISLSSDCNALLHIGHESADLAGALERVVHIIDRRIEKKLHILTTIIQPIFMIVLALGITALALLLYIPLFTMSLSISY